MQLPIPVGIDRFGVVKLVGPIVHWSACLLLLGVFAMFIPLSSRRRLIGIWIVAWAAELVGVTGTAINCWELLAGRTDAAPAFALFDPFLLASQFVFVAAVAIGSLGATGRTMSKSAVNVVLAAAAGVGLLLELTGRRQASVHILVVLTPIVFFGSAELMLLRAEGARKRGLRFLAVAMAIFGALATAYLLNGLIQARVGYFATILEAVFRSSGYADAAGTMLLGAAVIVVIMQESFLDTAVAHEERMHEVAASESRLNRIIQAAQEAIITTNGDGEIELANDAAGRMFADGSLTGRPLRSLFNCGSDANVANPGIGTPTLPELGDLSTRIATGRRPDGTRFPVEFTVGQLSSDDSPGTVVVMRDLTQRVAAEAERDAFERRMAESEKMLAIGRVVSGVAHELNNPLAVVLGQSEQLTDIAPSGEMRHGLELIHEHAHRARHIVRDLLAFVRPSGERKKPIDIATVVRRTVALQQRAALARNIHLRTASEPVGATVSADVQSIEQVLVNLVDNALDAAGEGGEVRVGVRIVGGAVEVAVEDNGPGLREEFASRVFEPFFTTKEPGRGTGLGLAVSQGIMQQHGGEIRLENRPAPGIGARFLFSLPLCAGQAVAASPVRPKRAFPEAPRRNGAPLAALLVDDEPAVRTTLAKMFQRSGWVVREAGSGDEALIWLRAVPLDEAPAVILCDFKMPGMSGQQLYEQLKVMRPDIAPRVIFVTGDVVGSTIDGFISASGREVIEKPFTVREIAAAVERTIVAGGMAEAGF